MRLIQPGWSVAALLSLLIPLAGCEYPMDVEDTTQHVLQRASLHAGVVSSSANDADAREAARTIAERAHAQVEFEEGPAEILMRELEKGELDIVVGDFAKNSPWKKRVTLSSTPEAKDPPKDEPVVRAALRHGENRWYMFIEKALTEKAS